LILTKDIREKILYFYIFFLQKFSTKNKLDWLIFFLNSTKLKPGNSEPVTTASKGSDQQAPTHSVVIVSKIDNSSNESIDVLSTSTSTNKGTSSPKNPIVSISTADGSSKQHTFSFQPKITKITKLNGTSNGSTTNPNSASNNSSKIVLVRNNSLEQSPAFLSSNTNKPVLLLNQTTTSSSSASSSSSPSTATASTNLINIPYFSNKLNGSTTLLNQNSNGNNTQTNANLFSGSASGVGISQSLPNATSLPMVTSESLAQFQQQLQLQQQSPASSLNVRNQMIMKFIWIYLKFPLDLFFSP
jgi:hypothetical protein